MWRNILAFACLSGFAFSVNAEEILLDDVPFKVQSPPGDWDKNMNCGPAAALMVAAYYLGGNIATTAELKELIVWLYSEGYISPQPDAEYYDGNATSANQLVEILSKYFGLDSVVKKNSNDLNLIKSELENGNPVIVAVNVQMNPQKMGHFMVVVGMTDNEIIVHDSGLTQGAFVKYDFGQFVSSWQTSNFSSVFVDLTSVTWHPDGTLIKTSAPEVYILIGAKKYWIIDEDVFDSHDFDWTRIIYVSQKELDCFPYGGEIDWQPYREVFKVGAVYYLMEKNSSASANCAIYEFSSETSFISWTIDSPVAQLSQSAADAQYFGKCADAGILYVRDGTLLKPDFNLAGYGSGVVFVATASGTLMPFVNWDIFTAMGYADLPMLKVAENEFYKSFVNYGQMIDSGLSEQCLSGLSATGGKPADSPSQLPTELPEEDADKDADNDGYSVEDGDCADTNPWFSPGQKEICDYVDNNCNGLIDEGVQNVCGKCGAVSPEFCDGVDNDCDGITDEGVSNLCGGCGTVPMEICDGIDNNCDGFVDEGLKNSCGGCGPLPVEICDGFDNDCDGAIDENVKNICGQCGIVSSEICDGIDNDCDGLTDESLLNACGQCGPLPVENCDGIDDDCDGLTDEGAECAVNGVCVEGDCQEIWGDETDVQPEDPGNSADDVEPPEFEKDEPPADGEKTLDSEKDEPPQEDGSGLEDEKWSGDEKVENPLIDVDSVTCEVVCPVGMKAYIWYASASEASGQSALMQTTEKEICERGAPWVDFDCACLFPYEWFCFDPTVALITCNRDFQTVIPGLIDYNGEGEIWFTDFYCFNK